MSGLTPHSDEIDFTGGLKNISFFLSGTRRSLDAGTPYYWLLPICPVKKSLSLCTYRYRL